MLSSGYWFIVMEKGNLHVLEISGLFMFSCAGETIISPGAKQGLIPLAIPLSKDSSGKKWNIWSITLSPFIRIFLFTFVLLSK